MAPNNEQRYDTHQYAGDQATQTSRTMQHMPDEDRTSRTDLQQHYNQSQAAELTPEVRMGDDRVIGDTPNWEAYSSEQLYNFATQNNSPSTADTLGRSFNTGGNNLATAANGLFDAVTMLDGAWSGVAADSARSALAPLAKAAGHAGQTAQLMGVRMSEQSVAASEVMKLPPPQEFNQQQANDAMLTGGIEAMNKDLKAQRDAADKVKKEQISYLTAYTNSMSAVDNATPSFVPPPKTINNADSGGTKITGGDVLVPTTSRKDIDPGTSTGAPSGGWTGAQPGAGIVPDGENQGGEGELPPIGGVGSSGTGASGYNPGGPPVSTPTSTGPGLGGGPHAGGPSAGAGGFGPGFGSFGGGGAGGAGGAGSGQGQGPGAGRGGGPAGPAPARGMVPPGMGGRPGGPGMGPGGAGGRRGQGEDDDEHERPSYLVEGDPEGTFGSDQMTAPAVIGDDDN